MNLPEEFLHYIWQFRHYDARQLRTTNGDPLRVIRPGALNRNAGPDFSNAKLQIAETTWIGNVEIHIKASDWLLHQHQLDHAYENVILHVVYEDDVPIYRKDGTLLPVLHIKGLFPMGLLHNYERLINSINSFPCEKQINSIDQFLVNNFLTSVLVERLIDKTTAVEKKLVANKGDWDLICYHYLAKNFGFKINAIPMEILAQSLPHQLFAKHKDNPLQVEALVFGQAGFLAQKFTEAYPKQLKREYQFLQKKYTLKPINVSLWKFMRLRPQNFPTLRLAQFSASIVKVNHLFSKILETKNAEDLESIFDHLPVHPFWQTHYHFNKTADQVKVQLGKSSKQSLMVNTLCLFLFAYGKITDQYQFVQRALELLENLPAEHNSIVAQFTNAGVGVKNAFTSQALLQLKKKYCNEKKCLNCGIGIRILNKTMK